MVTQIAKNVNSAMTSMLPKPRTAATRATHAKGKDDAPAMKLSWPNPEVDPKCWTTKAGI
jgi:hypothetical protein